MNNLQSISYFYPELILTVVILGAIIYDLFIDNGAFTGNSGNPGYSQDIAGVINLCGAMGDTAWIDPIETPIVSLHGTEDDVVPYGSELITLLGINVEVDGSGSIHEKLDQLGTVNALYTFQGAGHTPFVLGGEYMDTTIWFIRDFLYDQVCPEVSSIGGVLSDDVFFNVFPNPSDGLFNVDITGLADPNLQLTILDYTGARICSVLDVSEGTNSFGVSTLPSGLYLVRLDGEHLPRPYYQRLVVK